MLKSFKLLLLLVTMVWLLTACTHDVNSNGTDMDDTSSSRDTASEKAESKNTDSDAVDTTTHGSSTEDTGGTTDSPFASDSDADTLTPQDTATVTVVDTDSPADSDTVVDTNTPQDSDSGTVADSDTQSEQDTTVVGTDDTETVETETDTLPECYGQKMCEENMLMLCGAEGWVAYRDCAAVGTTCEAFREGSAICVADATPATSLVLTEISQLQVPPAGIRVVFSVEKDNGMPASGLTLDNFIIINDETGQPFNEGGGEPALGESEGTDFYTILTLDMSDSMFTPEDSNSAAEAVAAAKAFVETHVAGMVGGNSHYVAIYAFGSTAQSELVQDFTDDASLLKTQLDGLLATGSRGGTNLYGAYSASLDTLRMVDTGESLARLGMILLSDGLHESGNKEEMRSLALDSLALGGVDVYAIGMPGEYDEAELMELASNPFYFYSKDDGATLAQKFDFIGDTMAYMTGGNYVVGVCSPLESASSFTVQATSGELIGSLTVAYAADAEGWTGNVSLCDEATIADPCLDQQCGESMVIAGFECGTCGGATEYCSDTGMCIDDCENLFCGESPFLNLVCGTCGADQVCKVGVCEESNELTLEAECAVDMEISSCNPKYPGTNSNIVGDGHWDDKPYPAITTDGDLGYTDGGSWLAFDNIDLTKFNKVTIRYATAADASGQMTTGFNIRIDSPDGALAGQLVTEYTNSWTEYAEATANLNQSIKGTHTVYLVASYEGINNGNLDWVRFHK
ncbi:MAG: carbohydrate-binding protein [Deltaproteobacteria bacterium]|nr:carbohydrate-binding protein [Deltaproteobacteria bacterium]